MKDKRYNMREAAKELGVTRQTLYYWMKKEIKEVIAFHKVRESAPKEVQVCLEFSIEERNA